MEPEDHGFQKDIHFPGTYFSASMINFGGVWLLLKKSLLLIGESWHIASMAIS